MIKSHGVFYLIVLLANAVNCLTNNTTFLEPAFQKSFHQWISEVQKKYNLDLTNVRFEPKDYWQVNVNLNIMQFTINYPGRIDKGYYEEFDEFSLLHELGHVNNYKKYKFFSFPHSKLYMAMVDTVAGFCIAADFYWAYKVLIDKPERSLKESLSFAQPLIGSWIVLLSLGYFKHLNRYKNELMADDFACEKADPCALIAGYKYFKIYHEQVNNAYPNIFDRWFFELCDVHPSSKNRCKKIAHIFQKKCKNDFLMQDLSCTI